MVLVDACKLRTLPSFFLIEFYRLDVHILYFNWKWQQQHSHQGEKKIIRVDICQAFSLSITLNHAEMWCSVGKRIGIQNVIKKKWWKLNCFRVKVWKFFFLLSKCWSFICDRQERNECFMPNIQFAVVPDLVSNGSLAFTSKCVLTFNGNSVVLYSW